MSERGDNSKHGSASSGHRNQNKPKGGRPSVKERTPGHDDERASGPAENTKPYRADERTMDLVVDDVPYLVKVTPYTYNDEQRYYVCINGGTEHVFTWDSEIGGLRAIDDDASVLPDSLEEEISRRLQMKSR